MDYAIPCLDFISRVAVPTKLNPMGAEGGSGAGNTAGPAKSLMPCSMHFHWGNTDVAVPTVLERVWRALRDVESPPRCTARAKKVALDRAQRCDGSLGQGILIRRCDLDVSHRWCRTQRRSSVMKIAFFQRLSRRTSDILIGQQSIQRTIGIHKVAALAAAGGNSQCYREHRRCGHDN